MAPLFGKKDARERTVVLIDIENGSVGSALARLSPTSPPKLFGQTRKYTPLLHTRDAFKLSEHVHNAAREALLHAQEVAARIRAHSSVAPIGVLERGMVLLHGPWSGIHFGDEGRADVTAVESFLDSIRTLHSGIAGDMPVSFHSFGASTAPMIVQLYDAQPEALVCSVSSEISELFLVQDGMIVGYGTVPFGTHTLLRTLQTHAGLSRSESYSALQLHLPHAAEALAAAGSQLAQEFSDTARELLAYAPAPHVFVVAQEPFAHWFADALTHKEIGELFAEGGTVRAVRAAHVAPLVAAHAGQPDLQLMLGSLFADGHFSTVY